MSSGDGGLTRHRMWGREPEVRAVDDLMERATKEPAGLIVEGEAGIGKTTLWWAATERAESTYGFRVLTAQGSPSEVGYAYAAIVDLLRDCVDADDLAELPSFQRAALDRALSGAADGPATDERALAAAFLSVLDRLAARTPVLVAIDDAQYLDASSQAVIGYAARRFTGRTGLLITVRTPDAVAAAPPPPEWLQFSRPEALSRMQMSPLTLGGVHALVSNRLGRTLPRPVVTRVHQLSGGNPFFALELARAIPAGTTTVSENLPATLATLVRRRIGDHDGQTGAVLLAAASAAAPTVDLIALACGVTPQFVVESLEAIEDRGVVAIDGTRVRFTHPLFATGVYTDTTPARRRAMHRALAGIVEQPEVRARHLALATTTGDASTLKALDEAADVVIARGAPAVAAELVELAIKLGGDDPMRRLRVAELHFRAGDLTKARVGLGAMVDGLPAGNALRCAALMQLALVVGYDEDMVAACGYLTQAMNEADEHPALRLQSLLFLTPITGLTGSMGQCVEHAREAVKQAERLGDRRMRSQALTMYVNVNFRYGGGLDEEALRTALDLHDAKIRAGVTYHADAVAALMHGGCGALHEARAEMALVQQRFVARATEADIAWLAEQMTYLDVWLGNYRDALATAEEAVQRAEQMDGRHVLASAWCAEALAAAYLGQDERVRAASRAAIEATRVLGTSYVMTFSVTGLAFLEISLGDHAAAVAALEPVLSTFEPMHDAELITSGWLPDAIEALSAVDRVDEAAALVHALHTNGVRHDRPWMLAMAARGRGHVLATRGDLAGAEEAIHGALEHHDRLPMPFERARTLLLLGQVQRRRRRRQAATANLDEALRTFDALGTPLWARRARTELDRLATTIGDGRALTAAERRVAERAAAGLSNKEIAAQLFIAEKTVEMNLSNVYRKLGIRSRAALANRLDNREDQGKP